MKFTIDKDRFSKGLQIAGSAIGGANANQVLRYFKLDLNDDALEITASDGNISIITKITKTIDGAEVIRNATPGSILVAASDLADVRKFDNKEIVFEVIDDAIVQISDRKSSRKCTCLDAKEYPDVDFEKLNPGFTLLGADLSRLINQTSFAALTKDGRVVLTAINLKAAAGRLTATATDGARLSKKEVLIDSDARFFANISAKVASSICRLFDPGDTVEVSASQERMSFEFGGTRVHARLIAGDYPVSPNVIPSNFIAHLKTDANELLRALDRSSTYLTDNKVVKLSMSEDRVEISSREDQRGSYIESLDAASYEGEPIDISFNATFVSDAVKALGGQDVTLSFVDVNPKTFVVRNPADQSIVQLITPMRVK